MRTKVLVLAQYEENKAWYEGGEAWRPKFGREFIFEVPEGVAMYDDENMIKAFKVVLKNESNNCDRYTYVSHEFQFHDSEIISEEDFDNAYELIRREENAVV